MQRFKNPLILRLAPFILAAAVLAIGLGVLLRPQRRSAPRVTQEDQDATLRAAIQAAPSDPQPQLAYISWLLASQRRNDALSAARQARKSFPNSPEVAESLAEAQFETGRFPEAFATLRPVAAKKPEAKITLAQFLLRSGDVDGAVRLTAEIKPANPEQVLQVGQLYLDALKPEETVRVVKSAASGASASRDLRVTYGLALLLSGKYADAAKTFEPIVHGATDLPPVVHYYLGSALRLSGDVKRLPTAVAHLRRATQMVPQDAYFHYELALALAQLRDWDDVGTVLEHAGKLGSDVPEIHRDLSRIYHRQKEPVQEALAQARYLRMLDDPKAALRVLQAQVKVNPDSPELALAISGAQHHATDFPASVATLRAALRKQPDDAALLWALFRLLRAIQRYPEALEVMKSIEKQAPDDTAVLEEKADLLERLSRLPDAQALLVRLRDLEPTNPLRHYRLGYFLTLNSSDPEMLKVAETSLRKAIELRPESAEANYALGLLLHNTRRYPQAIPYLLRALDLLPAQPDPLRTLARCYVQTGDRAAADDCFTLLKRIQAQAAEKDRRQLPVDQLRDLRHSRAALAAYFLRTGNRDAATKELERLVHAYPDDQEAHRLLVGLYGHARRFQRQFEEQSLLAGH